MSCPTRTATCSRDQFEAKIAGLLGGHVAEEMVFGEMTTGARNDIEKATDIARQMVTQWGMSERLGPRTFGQGEELVFLGREIAEQRDYSEKVAEEIDEEVRGIVDRRLRARHAGARGPSRPAGRARDQADRGGDRRPRGVRAAVQRPPPKEDLHGLPPRRHRDTGEPEIPAPVIKPEPKPKSSPAPNPA